MDSTDTPNAPLHLFLVPLPHIIFCFTSTPSHLEILKTACHHHASGRSSCSSSHHLFFLFSNRCNDELLSANATFSLFLIGDLIIRCHFSRRNVRRKIPFAFSSNSVSIIRSATPPRSVLHAAADKAREEVSFVALASFFQGTLHNLAIGSS
jgi:hypothetical protein